MSAYGSHEMLLLQPDTVPGCSTSSLSRDVGKGVLLRLWPSVYVHRDTWELAPLWLKHRALTVAAGLRNPSTVMCGETALAMYGVPLLKVPRTVHTRTVNRGKVGTTKITVGAGAGFQVRKVGLPIPQGYSATEARVMYREDRGVAQRKEVVLPDIRLGDGSAATVHVEALPFVLVTTLPRMSFESAVVALDAILTGRYGYGRSFGKGQLAAGEQWLRTRTAQSAWRRAMSFADPRSESPGESRSRVVIDQLGFVAPGLQSVVRLPGGRIRRLDFDWPQAGVVGEFDGKVKYQGPLPDTSADGASVYWDEKWREEEIEEVTGKRFVRWRWQDLDEPAVLARRLALKGVPKR